MKELGNKIKTVTDTLGIKQCEKCKKNQETLNQVTRRGLLQGLATGIAAFTLGATSLKAQSAVAHDRNAVTVLRFLNTALRWHHQDVGKYVDLSTLMKSPSVHELIGGAAARHVSGDFIKSLDVTGPEIIPGWQLVYKNTDTGYSATIKTVGNSSFTFTTNEEGIIDFGQPIAVRSGFAGRLFAAAFRCIGPIGEPGCCCLYECCDQCSCCGQATENSCHCCWNCGCACCVWCETQCN